MRRLGDLPFDFANGACGTVMINDEPIILLCFSGNRKRCRSLKRKNNDALNTIISFDTIDIPDSKYDHPRTKMANYQGFPLIVGGFWSNVKLEMLVTVGSRYEWIDGPDYPYGQE